jgi:uncharacterized protein (TIGR03118 family)
MIASSSIFRAARQLVLLTCALALSTSVLAAPGDYLVVPLVADQSNGQPVTDTNLVNGWGIVASPTSPLWVSSNGMGLSTIYNGVGAIQGVSPVIIPPVNPADPHGAPTGIVFNLGASPTSTDFPVGALGTTTAARFLWATEDGAIAAWNGGASATLRFIATDGAVYKGLAMAGNGVDHFRVYAADFHNGKIDVIKEDWTKVGVLGAFSDPSLPPGFAPFNIMNIQGNLYVAYAMQQPGSDDELAGPGLGIVNVFDADGFLIERVATKGKLNAPWGMALAPDGFGKFSNMLLVGNFGDGTINAYNVKGFTIAGQLRANNKVLKIDGLWGITFGNGFNSQPTDTLFFAAGPDEEGHGLFGSIVPAP